MNYLFKPKYLLFLSLFVVKFNELWKKYNIPKEYDEEKGREYEFP